jgi:N-acyl-D-amino-acid deacylase
MTSSNSHLVLQGGTIVDGTGVPFYRGDVLIEDGRISGVGEVELPPGAEHIDVSEHVVAPGFIDMHSHSDLALLSEPTVAVKVRQGITTEVIGQDGTSYAPGSREGLDLSRELFAPLNGEGEDLDWSWRSVSEFLAQFQSVGQNVAYLLPQGTIRFSVLGTDDRQATQAEIEAMRSLVEEGMRDGAFGLSTGLTYPPGIWSPTEEVVELARVAGEHEGIYVTHHRNYGGGLADAIQETLDIGRDADIPVHFSHFHVSGPGREGRAEEFLAPLEAARESGLRVTLDVYPYTSGCTTLTAFLPSRLKGYPSDEILAELHHDEGRARVIEELRQGGPGETAAVGWEDFAVGGAANGSADDLRGKSLVEAARIRDTSLEALICDLLLDSAMRVSVVIFQGHQENVMRVLADAAASIGTDGILGSGVPHPRAAGTFPRILRYAREGQLSLERAVEMMTGQAAKTLGLRDRGTIRVGQAADVVVFDPASVADTANYADPKSLPVGIPHVLVNGEFVVRDSALTNATPGRVLRQAQASWLSSDKEKDDLENKRRRKNG